MTPRELEILNIIYRLGNQCSLRIISKETGLSTDYSFLISKGLLNQRLIKKTANNVFILTTSGKSLFERLRDGSEEKKKRPTLIEISSSFGSKVEPPSFEPEISFIDKGFVAGEPVITEHNLDKGLTTEVANARSVQKSIRRLTFVNRKRSKILKD